MPCVSDVSSIVEPRCHPLSCMLDKCCYCHTPRTLECFITWLIDTCYRLIVLLCWKVCIRPILWEFVVQPCLHHWFMLLHPIIATSYSPTLYVDGALHELRRKYASFKNIFKLASIYFMRNACAILGWTSLTVGSNPFCLSDNIVVSRYSLSPGCVRTWSQTWFKNHFHVSILSVSTIAYAIGNNLLLSSRAQATDRVPGYLLNKRVPSTVNSDLHVF